MCSLHVIRPICVHVLIHFTKLTDDRIARFNAMNTRCLDVMTKDVFTLAVAMQGMSGVMEKFKLLFCYLFELSTITSATI